MMSMWEIIAFVLGAVVGVCGMLIRNGLEEHKRMLMAPPPKKTRKPRAKKAAVELAPAGAKVAGGAPPWNQQPPAPTGEHPVVSGIELPNGRG